MKDIKESYLDKRPYSKNIIFDNYVFRIIDSTLANAREACSNLGQGFDVILSRFNELDVDMIKFAGTILKDKFDIEELPIGVIKSDRGMQTMSGGWFDGFTPQNSQTADDKDFYKTGLLVVKPSDNQILAPQAPSKIFKVVCIRKALFSEMSQANYNFMKNSFVKLEKTLDSGKKTMDLRELEYEGKPEGQPKGPELVLQPTKRFIDLTHKLNRVSSETGILSDSINTNFVTSMVQKAQDVFQKGLKNVFFTQLSPKQKDYFESALNLAGHIRDGISTFTGLRSTSKENVYTGELEVVTTSRAENYKLYHIDALGLDNGKGMISQKYLAIRNGISFTTDDLKWLGNCQVTKDDNGPICKSLDFNPSLEDRRCASQILLDQELDSCDFVSKLESMYNMK